MRQLGDIIFNPKYMVQLAVCDKLLNPYDLEYVIFIHTRLWL